MTYICDQFVEEQERIAHLRHRVEQLEANHSLAEEEAVLSENRDLAEQEEDYVLDEKASIVDRLYSSNGALKIMLLQTDLPLDVYSAICVAIVTNDLARRYIIKGTNL